MVVCNILFRGYLVFFSGTGGDGPVCADACEPIHYAAAM